MNEQAVPIIHEVQKIASERVPNEDFQQQVDRWNRYQESLDKIQRQCQIENVRFHRHLKTSYSERRIRNIYQCVAIGMLAASIFIVYYGVPALMEATKPISMYEVYYGPPNSMATIEDIGNHALAIGFLTSLGAFMFIFNRGYLPPMIKFECAPIMNIDDLYFIQRYVRGMARERHDPKVVLPALKMELPQSWISQQSLLKVMDTMRDIRLE